MGILNKIGGIDRLSEIKEPVLIFIGEVEITENQTVVGVNQHSIMDSRREIIRHSEKVRQRG